MNDERTKWIGTDDGTKQRARRIMHQRLSNTHVLTIVLAGGHTESRVQRYA